MITMTHPCFGGSNAVRVMERAHGERCMESSASMKVTNYLKLDSSLGFAVPKQVVLCATQSLCLDAENRWICGLTIRRVLQPKLQCYYHRPLHSLLRPFFENGFVLTGLLEPPPKVPDDYDRETTTMRIGMWFEFTDFPAVLAMRAVHWTHTV